MDIKLAYRKATIALKLPDGIAAETIRPCSVDRYVDIARFSKKLADAGGAKYLSENPLFVVNDGHRHTPTLQIFRWLDQIDPGLLDRSSFLIATGTHDAPTPAHYEFIFGEFYSRVKDRVLVHSATEAGGMTQIGTDRFDKPVCIDSRLLKAEKVCVIGSVEPHYFAGFTGGRKSLFPGLTDLATVERNHNLANSMEAMPTRLAGNPVAEHLEELTGLVDTDRFLSIQMVIDTGGRIVEVFAGGLKQTFADAVTVARGVYLHEVSRPYDAVICELLPPLDANLYQAQKALENCQDAVVDGGSIVVVSACEGGVGSPHFFEQAPGWDREANTPKDGVRRFGSHKLSRVNAIGRRIDVRLHSELEDDTARQVFYEPVADISAYIAERAKNNDVYSVAVVHDAGHTVLKQQMSHIKTPS